MLPEMVMIARDEMLFRQQVKTVAHAVELLNFVQDRTRMHGVRGFPENLIMKRKLQVG